MYHVERIDIRKDHALFAYADIAAACANNVYNVANFYIRNLMTGLKKEASLRTINEAGVIRDVAEGIALANAHNEEVYRKKAAVIKEDPALSEEERARKLSSIRIVHFDMPTAEKWFPGYWLLDAVLKFLDHPDYRSHHAHLVQNAIRNCCDAWKGFFKSLKKEVPLSGQTGRAKIPGYRKSGGRSTAVLSSLGCRIRDGRLVFPKSGKASLDVSALPHASVDKLIEVRVVPYFGIYQIQIVTDDGRPEDGEGAGTSGAEVQAKTTLTEGRDLSTAGIMSLDPGLDNFATLTDNKGFTPILIKGGCLKARNQWYNKRMAELRSAQMKGKDPKKCRLPVTKQMNRLSRKREAWFRDTFYKIAHRICRIMVQRDLDCLVIGHNEGQKQELRLGRKTNQEFVQIPYAKFNGILKSAAREYGICVIMQEESYTSKASFLDRDPIPVYRKEEKVPDGVFSGRRRKRGEYVSSQGIVLNADVNGSANIGRKCIPGAYGKDEDYSYLFRSVETVRYIDLLTEKTA